jgi:hypothetical protein
MRQPASRNARRATKSTSITITQKTLCNQPKQLPSTVTAKDPTRCTKPAAVALVVSATRVNGKRSHGLLRASRDDQPREIDANRPRPSCSAPCRHARAHSPPRDAAARPRGGGQPRARAWAASRQWPRPAPPRGACRRLSIVRCAHSAGVVGRAGGRAKDGTRLRTAGGRKMVLEYSRRAGGWYTVRCALQGGAGPAFATSTARRCSAGLCPQSVDMHRRN